MKFIVSSTDLLSRLQSISRVISNKNTMPILNNFLFHLRDNTLTITASDTETTMETLLTIENVEEEGAVTIAAKMLVDTLKEFPEQPLAFTVSSSNEVKITWPNGEFSLPGLPADDYPVKPVLDSAASRIEFPAEVLLEGLDRTLFATADDELRPVMNGVYFDLKTENTTMVASDSHKLMYYRRTDILIPEVEDSFILPKKPATLLRNILPKVSDAVALAFDKKNAVFTLPGYSLTCRLVEGNYPAYRSVIPSNNENKVTVDRLEFMNSVRRVSVCSNQASNLIKLEIAENGITVSAQDLDFSVSAHERVNCRYEGDAIEIGFKSNFLSEILANLPSTNVSLELSDASRAGLILPLETDDEHEETLALLMPMMINV
ncbi:MAG: DNA polymerase III subunit beta [Prevotellaceae bacterium]|jgi:DNA polymerase-3 subunit beta|nr:DNA polymerase III subunit beta [Prevotellaceae bacterium]